ncbi:MAG: M15 family metallopeptidase [Nocardioides sp.]|nr:M15 family metallopeptidase [Nocardioides sp.]
MSQARPRRARLRMHVVGVAVAVTAVLVAGCGTGAPPMTADPSLLGANPSSGAPATTASGAAAPDQGYTLHAVDDPGPLDGRLLSADLLIYSNRSLTDDERRRVMRSQGVTEALPMGLAQVAVDGRTIHVAAADPGKYRRYTLANAAQMDEIWQRVAHGEIAVEPELGKQLQREDGTMALGNSETAPALHIGAFASMVPQVHAVMNPAWGEALGMVPDNALLISTGASSPQEVAKTLRTALGAVASVQILGPDLDITAQRTAYLTGGSLAEAVGSFTYTPNPDGTVKVDPAWVSANIRTESVPILGNVTCHRAMLPQMRAALQEIVDRGLANKINPGEYAGCFYPRFIASNPAQGLSLHSWGIAFDINVPGNLRGSAGEIDRTVVAIFKKWGFAWGGDWSYTDPMHFEMAALVEPR